MSKRALILGIGGQDGSYLADILLEKGYEVHGLYRHSSVDNLTRIAHCRDRIRLHRGDITDYGSIILAIQSSDPHGIYHVADQDSVGWSKTAQGYQIDVTLKGALNVLDAVLLTQVIPKAKVFIPSSSTIYGDGDGPELDPRTPYAVAKAAVLHLCRYYRREYGLQVYCGIMYGHDSPRRGPDYLLQKIARGKELGGDLTKKVDIGYAEEFMQAVVSWIGKGEPGERVFRSGIIYSIRDLIRGPDVPNGFLDGVELVGGGVSRGAYLTLLKIKGAMKK